MRAYDDTDASGHELGDWPTEDEKRRRPTKK
jgi:hypothetical protein